LQALARRAWQLVPLPLEVQQPRCHRRSTPRSTQGSLIVRNHGAPQLRPMPCWAVLVAWAAWAPSWAPGQAAEGGCTGHFW